MERLPIIVIGAGPVGLAAAAHLVERGMAPLILERGADVAAAVSDWGHVRLFSPWRFDVDRAAARLLEASGWTAPPPDELPTGQELADRYLRPLARLDALRPALHLGHRVIAITRQDADKVRTGGRDGSPFVVRAETAGGRTRDFVGRAIIDASGTWWSPNPIGASGIAAHGETASDHIQYGIPDVLGAERARDAGRRTLVVGAGHSAANALLALLELARSDPRTSIVWATRGADVSRVFGGGAADALPARGALGAELAAAAEAGRFTWLRGMRISAISDGARGVTVSGTIEGRASEVSGLDNIVGATGQRPDLDFLRELRLTLDPALECAAALGPLIDPNEHSCGTVRPHGARELAHAEPGYYAIGGKSYGRAPTFLMATGYEQARSVVAMLAGDTEAALRVELDLPETGVCSTDTGGASCCAPSASTAPTECCVPSSSRDAPSC